MFVQINNFVSTIPDIDLPLYKYGLIHRQNIGDRITTKKKKILQILKFYSLIIWQFFNIFRYSLFTIYYNSEKYPIFYYSLIKFLGGLTEFYYILSALLALMVLRVIWIFNLSEDRLYKWLDIIKVLKGLKPLSKIGIYEKNGFHKIVLKFKFLLSFIKIGIYFVSMSVALVFIFILINFFESFPIFIYTFQSGFSDWIYFNSLYFAIIYCSFYFFIVCYFINLRFKALNRKITRAIELSRSQDICDILKDHNSICNDIFAYNNFWKKCFSAITLCIFPSNLMFLQEIIYEDLIFLGLVASTGVLVGYLTSHFVLNWYTALINKNAMKSRKNLIKLYIFMVDSSETEYKIKVICSSFKLQRRQ